MGQPQLSRYTLNGVALAMFHWAGAGQPVLFVHANGFHARCWDQVIAQLPGCDCYALDLRGHGRSGKQGLPCAWRQFGEDVAALAREIDLRGAIGVGHSLGGHAVTLAAALAPEAFAQLLLIDPVILPRAAYVGRSDGEHFAARRRDRWESPQAMFERFKDRAPFDRWLPAVLRDYCDYGLVPADDGNGFQLACPPAVEAAIYGGATEADVYPEIATIAVPVTVWRAGRIATHPTDMSGSITAPDLASHFRYGHDRVFAEYSHFLPMEAPEVIAAQLSRRDHRDAQGEIMQ